MGRILRPKTADKPEGLNLQKELAMTVEACTFLLSFSCQYMWFFFRLAWQLLPFSGVLCFATLHAVKYRVVPVTVG